MKKGDSYIVTLSAFEIYQEKLIDLFDKQNNLILRKKKNPFI